MPNSSTAQAGATSNEGNQNLPAGDSGHKSFTQEEVNSLLANQKREMQAKYKDFDVYKQVYEEQKQKADADKTELEKTQEALAEAQKKAADLEAKQNQAAWVQAASKATGVPVEALHGSTEEEVNQCAEALKSYFEKPAAPHINTGQPSSDGGTGTSGDPLRDLIFGNN